MHCGVSLSYEYLAELLDGRIWWDVSKTLGLDPLLAVSVHNYKLELEKSITYPVNWNVVDYLLTQQEVVFITSGSVESSRKKLKAAGVYFPCFTRCLKLCSRVSSWWSHILPLGWNARVIDDNPHVLNVASKIPGIKATLYTGANSL